ncbi:RNA ligase RtcB family protein [Clostridioides sp. ZZV15-6388]|uniref:RNA ligase RtcB family protein n=1 Tax=unclassified Clostridioides TaxID=2635829 RepID=UPI001D111DE0|nr:RNA ligase RtcB family protein [Clostridioides sp. ZZV15-6388]MCC0666056.1 RNA ligase RtcB family protein [Clostridioides sp. ZZV15-6597]
MSEIKVIANNKCWIEDIAKRQLEDISKLNGILRIVGLPDLHAGKIPVGLAVETEGIIYPHIIGNDIGCGMTLFKTGISKKKFKKNRWIKRLSEIKDLSDIKIMNPHEEECPISNLGTIGSGNHFIEFQCVNEIHNKEKFEQLRFSSDDIMMLVHCGSRNYGETILKKFYNKNGIEVGSEKERDYMINHDKALIWSERNREIVSKKIMQSIGISGNIEKILSINHNFIEKREDKFIHRKGAISSERGAVIIPGSRGSLSYIVMPTENTEQSLYSLSHGAGRKWSRSICKSRLKNKYNKDTIKQTKFKSYILCNDINLLFQEAPEAYKNIEQIIESLIEYKLIQVVATMKPLITYKG